jgi:hypothetical protein
MPCLSVLFVMSPLALVGFRQEDDDAEAGQEEGRGEIPRDDSDSNEERSESSSDSRVREQELEDLVGFRQEDDDAEAGQEEGRGEIPGDNSDSDSNEEQSESSSDSRVSIIGEQELEDIKFWASSSSSLLRIYLCHACDDVYDEVGAETFGRSLVIFRDSPSPGREWRKAPLSLGGFGYHRAMARRTRQGRGIKAEDRDVFDNSGLGGSESEGDGWPLP